MAARACTKTIDLEAGELLQLLDAQGTTVRVSRGSLWLTQDRDTRDIVLRPGDAWMIERRGLTLVEAQSESVVTVTGIGARRTTRNRRRMGLPTRVREWVGRVAQWTLRNRWVPYY